MKKYSRFIMNRNIYMYGGGFRFSRSCVWLCTKVTIAYWAPLSLEFSGYLTYWSGLPFPSWNISSQCQSIQVSYCRQIFASSWARRKYPIYMYMYVFAYKWVELIIFIVKDIKIFRKVDCTHQKNVENCPSVKNTKI